LAFPASMPQVMAVTALAGPKIQYQPWYASKGNNLFITTFGGDNGQDQDQNGMMDGIYSTDLTGSGYGLRMGTSMACPQFAGLVALARSSGMPSRVIRSSLAGTATDLGAAGYDLQFGHGLMSGRSLTTTNPRVYAVVTSGARVVSISLVQTDGSFLVGNLPPSSSAALVLVSDQDNNGLAGEAGDLRSSSMVFDSKAGQVSQVGQIAMSLANGQNPISLEIK
jgi:serine protease